MTKDSRLFADADSDQEILECISAELDKRLPSELMDSDRVEEYAAALCGLPGGLRSMASIYQLDVSVTLDDLGWHFANWHSHVLASETARGLRYLGAERAPEVFEAAYALARRWWTDLESDEFVEWYGSSELERSLRDLNREMWSLRETLGEFGLLQLWVKYARCHPEMIDQC